MIATARDCDPQGRTTFRFAETPDAPLGSTIEVTWAGETRHWTVVGYVHYAGTTAIVVQPHALF